MTHSLSFPLFFLLFFLNFSENSESIVSRDAGTRSCIVKKRRRKRNRKKRRWTTTTTKGDFLDKTIHWTPIGTFSTFSHTYQGPHSTQLNTVAKGENSDHRKKAPRTKIKYLCNSYKMWNFTRLRTILRASRLPWSGSQAFE